MTNQEFFDGLREMSASKEIRQQYANRVLKDMSFMPILTDTIFMVNDTISFRAAWVFEIVCDHYIFAILPYLDVFTQNLSKIHFDSAIRPIAKVCVFIANAYYSKENNTFKRLLKPEHKQRIIETSFDWMINKNKVATKVHAMETLFLFGQDNNWIHTELVQILERDFNNQSAGFKSRAKKILMKIKKSSKS